MNKFNVITISEGAAGMRSQIEGLASLISEDYKNFDLKIKSFFKYLPIELIPSSSFAYINLSSLKIEKNTILISCGKKSVKASIFNIHIQNPKVNHNLFDLIVCPEHDNLDSENCISTLLAIHNIKFNKNARNNKTINFIIGGPNKYFKFNQQTQKKILNEIKFLSEKFNVNIIPSRRTPNSLLEELSKINSENIYMSEDLFNPKEYGELLSQAHLQIVTWDSISMISEAISSEAGTFLFKFEEELCPKRYHQFFDKITSSNFAQFYDQNIKPYEISISEYNEALKTKILNKIQSNLRFISEDA
ncbi:mitochondrial fission ELM1 family protein [Alphaproteobacteria bacterium]|nr:mitochondrial fission ELM1 family protein [Alphaproteobacteria bacterium]